MMIQADHVTEACALRRQTYEKSEEKERARSWTYVHWAVGVLSVRLRSIFPPMLMLNDPCDVRAVGNST